MDKLEIVTFSRAELLEEYIKKPPTDVILMEVKFEIDAGLLRGFGRAVYLCGGVPATEKNGARTIARYKKPDLIYKDILALYTEGGSSHGFRMGDRGSGKSANILSIGIPASLGSLLMSVSQIIVNARMAEYGDMALAGIGVAMKVTMITGMVCIGFGQGVQPLLGYCAGAQLWKRFKKIMHFSVFFSLGLSAVMTGRCYLLRDTIIQVFLTEPASFDYAITFTGILLTTSVLFGVFYVLTNALQAMGAAVQALIINLSRQGIIYIPALFLLQSVLGANGLAWVQPVADLLSTTLAAGLYLGTSRKMMEIHSVSSDGKGTC